MPFAYVQTIVFDSLFQRTQVPFAFVKTTVFDYLSPTDIAAVRIRQDYCLRLPFSQEVRCFWRTSRLLSSTNYRFLPPDVGAVCVRQDYCLRVLFPTDAGAVRVRQDYCLRLPFSNGRWRRSRTSRLLSSTSVFQRT